MAYSEVIRDILLRASAIARDKFGMVAGVVKLGDNNQVLTEADIAIGDLMVSLVRTHFPEHNVIDEEAGTIDQGSDYTWVIDPIDGTSNFANGIATYGIMLGLLHGATPIAGGIALPAFEEVCLAEQGKGAFSGSERLAVTAETRLLSSLVAYGIDGHQEAPDFTRREAEMLAEIVLGIRNLRGSNSCFDAVMLAKGKYGGYLNRTSKIWDNVAQQIIIEEAGGTYTDFFGNPIDYSNPLTRVNQNFEWCTAPPVLHSALQAIIHAQHE